MTTNEAFAIIEETIHKAKSKPMGLLPHQKMTLIEAANLIHEIAGANANLSVNIWPDRDQPVVFGVWDGENGWVDATLEGAVQKCLDAHNGKKPPVTTIDQANAMLLEASAPAF